MSSCTATNRRRGTAGRTTLLALAALVVTAAPAGAQEVAVARTRGALTQVELTAFAARDRSTAPSAPGGGFRADLRHVLSGQRFQLDVSVSTQARRESTGSFAPHDQRASVNLRTLLSRRTTLTLGQSASYSPYYDPGTLAGSGVPGGGAAAPAGSLGALDRSTLAAGSLVRLTRQLSRRAVATVGYGFDRVWFPGGDGGAVSHRASLRLDRSLDRDLDLRLRYGLLVAATDARRGTTQELEAGIAYRPRALRGTTLFAALAPTLSSQRDLAGRTGEKAPDGAFTMGGIVGIERQLSEGWDAALAYRRSVYYLRGTAEAVGADALDGRVGGELGGGVEVSLALSASLGRPTLTDSSSRLSSLGLIASLRVPLWRNAFVDAEYRRERYSLGDVGSVAQGPPLDRSRLQVGVTFTPGHPASRGRGR